MKKNQIRILIGAAVLTGGVLWTAQMGRAFNPQPDPPGFGAIGMIQSQTMRLKVVCLHNPPDDIPVDACSFQLNFADPSGRIIKQDSRRILPDQATFLDITATDLRSAGWDGTRAELVPAVMPAVGCRVIPTVEVFDTRTGKTEVFANPAVPRLSFLSLGR
jgi:hypothetical protein